MKALEYGSGTSSIWIALHTGYTIAMENQREWAEGLTNFTQYLGLKVSSSPLSLSPTSLPTLSYKEPGYSKV